MLSAKNLHLPSGAGSLWKSLPSAQGKQQISLAEFQDSMNGIWTTSVGTSTIDESPMAYKPMDAIVDNIDPTVEIEQVIKPVYNFKASE